MQRLWRGPCSIRKTLKTFRSSRRPAYTTVQTMFTAWKRGLPEAHEEDWLRSFVEQLKDNPPKPRYIDNLKVAVHTRRYG
jgi:hypothetical protein